MNELVPGIDSKEYYEQFVPWVRTEPRIAAGKTYLETYLEMKRVQKTMDSYS